jgi:sugar transferase (PEP-CTERM/EpsH1 system associated)
MRNLLYLVHRIPYPPNKGDKIRSYHLFRFLAERYRVFLATFVDDPADWRFSGEVQTMCAEAHFAALNPKLARLRSARGLPTGAPLSLPYYADAKMRRWVDDVVRRNAIKHVVAFSSPMAQFADHLNGARRIMDFVDVDSDKWAQYAKSKSWPMNAVYRRESRALLRYERAVAARWDASVFVSDDEARLFAGMAPESAQRVHGVYNGVDFDYFSPDRTYDNPFPADVAPLVFTGAMDYWANVDAVDWFAREVFPAVRARHTRAAFYIVGSHPAPAVQALAQMPGVVVTGSVPDVRPYLHHARGAVAPLRIARGIQNKVLEAMSMGKVVVATREAAEGLRPCPNTALLVAADATAMVDQCARVLAGHVPADAGTTGRACITANYDWNRNLALFADLLER